LHGSSRRQSRVWLPYTVGVRHHLVILLSVLAIPLMGSQCDWGVAVDNRIPSEEEQTEQGGGLTFVARSGDGVLAVAAASASNRSIVESALATSVLAVPGTDESSTEPVETSRDSGTGIEAAVGLAMNGAEVAPSSAVPEPTGLLLFSMGLGMVGYGMRRLRTA
jgi:hypothetical protein